MNHAFKLGRIGFLDRFAPARDACVVDDNTDAAKIGDNVSDQFFAGIHVGDRGRIGPGLPAQRFYGGHSFSGGRVIAPVINRNVGAQFGEPQGYGPANAPAAAGDQGNSSLKRFHSLSPNFQI